MQSFQASSRVFSFGGGIPLARTRTLTVGSAGDTTTGKKTTNFDAMRDLNGRRIRHVKAVERIKEWLEKKKKEDELVTFLRDFLWCFCLAKIVFVFLLVCLPYICIPIEDFLLTNFLSCTSRQGYGITQPYPI